MARMGEKIVVCINNRLSKKSVTKQMKVAASKDHYVLKSIFPSKKFLKEVQRNLKL